VAVIVKNMPVFSAAIPHLANMFPDHDIPPAPDAVISRRLKGNKTHKSTINLKD
jgi:hypothetical protein